MKMIRPFTGLAALALIAAACGGGGESADSTSPATTSSTTTTTIKATTTTSSTSTSTSTSTTIPATIRQPLTGQPLASEDEILARPALVAKIDNNAAERALRNVALGRNEHLAIVWTAGGRLAA